MVFLVVFVYIQVLSWLYGNVFRDWKPTYRYSKLHFKLAMIFPPTFLCITNTVTFFVGKFLHLIFFYCLLTISGLLCAPLKKNLGHTLQPCINEMFILISWSCGNSVVYHQQDLHPSHFKFHSTLSLLKASPKNCFWKRRYMGRVHHRLSYVGPAVHIVRTNR